MSYHYSVQPAGEPFDYSDLVAPVRRLINDEIETQVDLTESTESASYYITLTQDAYCVPVASGVVINGTPLASGDYTVTKNLIRCSTIIPAGSDLMVEYEYSTYTDSRIIDYIGDAIHNTVEPLFNMDFEFGVEVGDETLTDTQTWYDVTQNFRALFAAGAAMQLKQRELSEAGDDAIYIKDGDTVIDTATSSKEKGRGYDPIKREWDRLVRTVQQNIFEGVVMV